MPDERLYTNKEISAILKRAGEMEIERGSEPSDGLTLAELRQIAADTGLDPHLVVAAASELSKEGDFGEGASIWAIDDKMQLERLVPGEITTDVWPKIAAEIGAALGCVGTSGRVGQSYEWTHAGRRVQYQVTLAPEEGQTRIRIFGDFAKLPPARRFARAIWVVQAGLLGMIVAANSASPAAVTGAIALLSAMVVYCLIHFGFNAYTGKRIKTGKKLLGRLEKILSPPKSATAQAQTGTTDARITLEDEDIREGAPAAVPARNRTS